MPAVKTENTSIIGKNVRKYVFTIAGNGSDVSPERIHGTISKIKVRPGTGGAQPTNGFNVAITDDDGDSVIATTILNGLSNAATTVKAPNITSTDGTNTAQLPNTIADFLTVTVSGAGSSASVAVAVYVA